jgi:SPP1 gp7 family putative phage head morphogenesis protein
MKKYEKEILQNTIDGEKEVIKKLKSVYEKCLKDIEEKTKELQKSIIQIQDMIDTADEKDIEMLKSMAQSKIYQKQYQQALKGQIEAILNELQVNEFTTITEYLEQCYNDGFLSVMYSLQQQGIPLILPINQEEIARAITLDSKISEGLYTRLGEDTKELKKKISQEISRGIATNTSYNIIANNLKKITNIGYNNAIRITRTEGNRINNQSAYDTCVKAKKKGCKIVKQWDATLDGKTRDSHRAVDGEIREIDEPFSNGLMFPSDPDGAAAEVVNCRCALLERAKWALDDDELQTLKDRAAYFGLDKTNNFNEYKQKYLKATEEYNKLKEKSIANSVNNDKIKPSTKEVKVTELDIEMQEIIKGYTGGGYTDICQYSQYLNDKNSLDVNLGRYESLLLPNVSEKIKQETVKLMRIIESQPVSNKPICRLERQRMNTPQKGDTLNFGIRSASKDMDFAEKVLNSQMGGIGYNGINNDGKYIEYIFDNSKSLDISSISYFPNQQEVLVCGKYKVIKTETIKPIEPQTKWITQKEYLASKGIEYAIDVNINGKKIAVWEEFGERQSLVLDVFEKMPIAEIQAGGQLGRTKVYLIAEND